MGANPLHDDASTEREPPAREVPGAAAPSASAGSSGAIGPHIPAATRARRHIDRARLELATLEIELVPTLVAMPTAARAARRAESALARLDGALHAAELEAEQSPDAADLIGEIDLIRVRAATLRTQVEPLVPPLPDFDAPLATDLTGTGSTMIDAPREVDELVDAPTARARIALHASAEASDTRGSARTQTQTQAPVATAAFDLPPADLAAIQDLLLRAVGDEAAATAVHADATRNATAPAPTTSTLDIPIDAELLARPDLCRAAAVRYLEQALGTALGELTPRDLQIIYADAGWTTTLDGKPATDDTLRAHIAARLAAGDTTLPYTGINIAQALDRHTRALDARVASYHAFMDDLANESYATDAIRSFFVAHLNGVIEVANLAIDAVSAVSDAVGGPTLPTIPTIEHTGEYGQKYGPLLDDAAATGLLLVSGGAIAGAADSVLGSLAGLELGTIPIGTYLVNLTKASLLGYGASELHASAEQFAEDALTVEFGTITEGKTTRDATPEELHAAQDRISLAMVSGAAAGASAKMSARGLPEPPAGDPLPGGHSETRAVAEREAKARTGHGTVSSRSKYNDDDVATLISDSNPDFRLSDTNARRILGSGPPGTSAHVGGKGTQGADVTFIDGDGRIADRTELKCIAGGAQGGFNKQVAHAAKRQAIEGGLIVVQVPSGTDAERLVKRYRGSRPDGGAQYADARIQIVDEAGSILYDGPLGKK